ncbi:MAG: helix-turn-helix domain-containing protein [Anaerolineaceae bacterium]
MEKLYSLKTLEELKALSDPLRLRLIEAFSNQPMTTRQVARLLDEKPTRLYHHVEALEKLGLLKLVETRQNRGTVEHYYQAIAGEFTVDSELLNLLNNSKETAQAVEDLLVTALKTTLGELRRSLRAGLLTDKKKYSSSISTSRLMLTKEEVEKLQTQLHELIHPFETVPGKSSGPLYNLTVALFPVEDKPLDGEE